LNEVEVMRKRLEWALRQRLEEYKGMEYTEESLGRIAHEISKTLDRFERADNLQ